MICCENQRTSEQLECVQQFDTIKKKHVQPWIGVQTYIWTKRIGSESNFEIPQRKPNIRKRGVLGVWISSGIFQNGKFEIDLVVGTCQNAHGKNIVSVNNGGTINRPSSHELFHFVYILRILHTNCHETIRLLWHTLETRRGRCLVNGIMWKCNCHPYTHTHTRACALHTMSNTQWISNIAVRSLRLYICVYHASVNFMHIHIYNATLYPLSNETNLNLSKYV